MSIKSIFEREKNSSKATKKINISNSYDSKNIKPSSSLNSIEEKGAIIQQVKDRSLATDLDGGPIGIRQERTIKYNVPLSSATDKTINHP